MKKLLLSLLLLCTTASAQNFLLGLNTNTLEVNLSQHGLDIDDVKWSGLNMGDMVRTNFFIIRSLADLPSPVNGVITTIESGIYEINGDVDIGTNSIVLLDQAWFRGASRGIDTLISSATGFVFKADAATVGFNGLAIIASEGSFAQIHNSTTNLFGFIMRDMRIDECDSVLSFSNITRISISDLLVVSYTSSVYGIRFAGTNESLLNINDIIIVDSGDGSTAIDLGDAVWFNPTIDEGFIDVPSGGIGLRALTNSQNVSLTGLGALRNTIFRNIDGTGTNLIGLTLNDQRWELSQNPGIAASSAITSMYITNQVTTSIASVNTPVNVTGDGGWVQADSAGFLFSTNGILTYNKAVPKTVYITASMTMEPTSGNRALAAYIAVNSTNQVLSKFPLTVGNGSPAPFLPQITLTLNLGDEITLQVENESNNSDINVNTVKFIVTGN